MFTEKKNISPLRKKPSLCVRAPHTKYKVQWQRAKSTGDKIHLLQRSSWLHPEALAKGTKAMITIAHLENRGCFLCTSCGGAWRRPLGTIPELNPPSSASSPPQTPIRFRSLWTLKTEGKMRRFPFSYYNPSLLTSCTNPRPSSRSSSCSPPPPLRPCEGRPTQDLAAPSPGQRPPEQRPPRQPRARGRRRERRRSCRGT